MNKEICICSDCGGDDFTPIAIPSWANEYEERCAEASKRQGIDGLIEELETLGIKATSHQTGGFTMCAYIDLGYGRYIYANPYGAGVYDEDDYEIDLIQLDEENTGKIAEVIANYLKGGE